MESIENTTAENISLEELKKALSKPEEIPLDTRPITQEEFMNIMSRFKHCKEFENLPLPAFAYQDLPEYKDKPESRIEENYLYQVKQMTAKTPKEKENNMRDRLLKKLADKQAKLIQTSQ